ncbi:MAG: 1-acyl-sn-glycerol-3-phosphate acyltransferase [Gammaproteobacteria bacterium]|nr:1-acyl-sn-glycerol-3-phosphate acyltransferase [Gammaproteobacteria bacterium]
MTRLLRTCQYHLKMALIGLWCALVTILFYLISFPANKKKWLAWAYAQALNMGVRTILGVKVNVIGRENMIAGPAVIIMNHQSNFDPLLQGVVYPKNAIIIGKKELEKIPLWGRIFYASNNIMVDRHGAGKSSSAVDLSVERLKNDDCYIWIFPEGTRSLGGKMNAFKNGAFRMAIGAGVPIIPMVSKPLQPVLDVPNKLAIGGEHEIKILPWISTDGMSNDDVENLIVKCSDIYREELSKYLDCDPDEVFRKEKA